MNSVLPPRRSFTLLGSVLALGVGVVFAVGYGWLLVQQPDAADQATAVVVIGATILLTVVNPLAGLLAWLFLAPFSIPLPFNIRMPAGIPDLTFMRLVGSFLALYLVAQVAQRKRRLASSTAVELTLPIFALALVLAAVRASDGALWGLQTIFDAYLTPLLVYFVARQLIHGERQLRPFVSMLLAIGAVIAVLALLEQLFGIALLRWTTTEDFYAPGVRKVGALLGNPAYIAFTLAIILPFIVERIVNAKTPLARLSYFSLVILFVTAIFFTYNRSGWLAGLIGIFLPALYFRESRRFAVLGAVIGGIVLALVWNSAQDTAAGRRLSAESPIDYRVQAIDIGLQIARDEPLLGVGWNTFSTLAAERGWRPSARVLPTTHNTYLNFLVSGGVFLLGAFLLLAAAVFVALWRIGRAFRRSGRPLPAYLPAAWTSVIIYFVASVGFENHFALYANLILWGIVGATLSAAWGDLQGSDPTEMVRA